MAASSSMAKRGVEATGFFVKIILNSTLLNKMLRIPRVYGNQLLGSTATLEVPSGDKWEVELVRDSQGVVWFCNTVWERFSEFYSLEFGHLLLFEYRGLSAFLVVIFDTTAVEIEYPVREAARVEVEQDSISLEILDVADRSEEKGKSPVVGDADSNQAAEEEAIDLEDAYQVGGMAGNGFTSEHPFFKVKIATQTIMYIPKRFTKEHSIIKSVKHVKLEANGKVWAARIYVQNNKYVKLGSISFLEDNKVKSGDVCFFELIATFPDIRMKVTILRDV
ncbi:B3 domain-containing protein At4g01580 [Linum perenne]